MQFEIQAKQPAKRKPISKWYDLVTTLIEIHGTDRAVVLTLDSSEYLSTSAIQAHLYVRTRKAPTGALKLRCRDLPGDKHELSTTVPYFKGNYLGER